jgi:hypothetical protein
MFVWPQQSASVFDPLLVADFRPAFVPRQIEHNVFRQPSLVTQP